MAQCPFAHAARGPPGSLAPVAALTRPLVAPGGLDPADFECPLCLKLLVRPTTTPCGHTFCFRCLARALEARYTCPLCRYDFEEYPAVRPNILLVGLVEKHFPEEMLRREKEQEADEQEERAQRDIFFLTRQLAVTVAADRVPGGAEPGAGGPMRYRWTLDLGFLNKSVCPYSLGSSIPVGFYLDHVVVHLGPKYQPDRVVLHGPDFTYSQVTDTESVLILDLHFQPRFQHAPLRVHQPLSFAEATGQVVLLQFDSRMLHD